MKKHLSSRVLSLLLVVALFVGLVVPVNAAASDSGMQDLEFEKTDETVSSKLSESVLDEESSESDEQYAPDDTVRVSIVLEDASTIERFGATDIASNASAMAYRRRLKNTQVSMTSKIDAATGVKLDVAWNLTLAANIISANVRYDAIEKIEKVPGVKSVEIETRYEPMVASVDPVDPNMATSSSQIGSSTAWAAGYTGAGSKVAVIDTGIDYEHQSFDAAAWNYSMQLNADKKGMTLDEYKASVGVMTEDDVSKVLSQLNVTQRSSGVTAEKLYLNDKIPFAYNYVDRSFTVDHMHDSQGEHGSHVEGIAAANAYIPNSDGTFSSALDAVKVQGVAPDAQIVTMKVFGAGGGASDSDYMAAIEDAIILGCDSVNLSLGSGNPGFSRAKQYQDVMDSLAENGVVVCMSAGNSYNWANSSASGIGYLYDDEISFQTGGSPGSFTNSLTVASVENDGTTGNFFTVGEQNVFYTETFYSNAALTTLEGEHDYVILPAGVAGAEADFEGIDVEGKVVFVQRGVLSFYEKANYAVKAGAIATIVYNNTAGSINMNLTGYTGTAPCVSISQTDGLAIWDASEQAENGKYATGTMTVRTDISSTGYDSEYYTMSDFSSWGVPGSLELKPEITAPGGNIYSVFGANKSSDSPQSGHTAYENMSGTSMASPQVAGMAAVLGQYIRENGLVEKTGKSARQLINSLLMSTAEPMIDGDSETPYSVLNQGAGLANVGNAVNADSYIMMKDNLSGTAADGKVKAEFGDDPEKTGVYTAEFSINNLSGEAQEYTFSTDVFTQDVFDYDGVNYLDTWTKMLAADVTYDVDGQTFVPTSKVECDVDRDGDTDADDAQCILEHVAGNHTSDNCDLTVADLDGDGEVTTHDAYLLLKGLTVSAVKVPANSAVNVKVTIKLTDDTKEYLDETYPVGAYIEGYIYVNTANTADGEILPAHSIPMLGFYGNWSDGSALDTSTYLEKLYGDDRRPHTGVMATNYQSIYYPGEKDDYVYTVNPYLIEGDTTADIPYDRAAINSESSMIGKYVMTVERNAAAAVYFVQDGDGNVVYTGGVTEQFYGAYYYVNGGRWDNTRATLTVNQKPGKLGFKEGDTFTAGVALIPEYYEEDGAMTTEQVKALIESGKLGDGCLFTYTYTVDNTAPEAISIQKDLQTGALTVAVKDNQYVAYLAVYKGKNASDSKLIAGGLPKQDEAGEVCGAVFKLDDSVGEYVTVVVADYAGNETQYKVKYGGTPENFSGRMFGFTDGTSRGSGSGSRWVEIDPATLSKTTGMSDYAEVDYKAYAAEYAGKHIFFATADGIYAAEQEDPTVAQKVTSYGIFDSKEMVADMAFNTQDKMMYVLTNTISEMSLGTIGAKGNKLYKLDPVSGVLTKIADVTITNPMTSSWEYNNASTVTLRAMTIDDSGNFYAVNAGSNTVVRLYKWTLADIDDAGKLNVDPVSKEKLNNENNSLFTRSYASMAYDHDKDIIYLAGSYKSVYSSVSIDNELWIIDPETATASRPGTVDASFYDHVVGLYVVPASTITLPEKADVTSVALSETQKTVLKGSAFSLEADVYPWLVEDKSVTWSVDNEDILSVDNGEVKALNVGEAKVTATSVADPTKSAICTVTVEALPEIEMSGLIYDADEKTYWSDFSADAPSEWTKAAEGSSYLAGALLDGELVLHDGSNLFGVDPDTFEVTPYGGIASSWIWSDAAEAPLDDDGLFGQLVGLCYNGTVLELLNPSEGSLDYFDLINLFADDPMAAIAYVGAGTYEYDDGMWGQDCPAYFYYVMTESGTLYQFAVFCAYDWDKDEDVYRLALGVVGSTGLELTDVSAVTKGKYASMLYDQDSDYLVLSTYLDGDTAKLYVIDLDTLIPAEAGDFGADVWPVVSLYQYEKVSTYAANSFAGNGMTASAADFSASVQGVALDSFSTEAAPVSKPAANKATGSLNAVKATRTTDKNTDGTYNVVVKISDTEAVTNGKYVVSYDPSKLTYVSSSGRVYSAIHVDEEKGEITLAYANATEAAAGTVLGTIKFAAEKNVQTTVSVTTEERNDNTDVSEAPATVTVDTTEKDERPIIVVPTKPGAGSDEDKFPFTDVSKYDDCYDAVKYLYNHDIMNGTSDTLFSPNAELTRAMVVTILYRMEGEPFTTGAKTFSDVADGLWYTEAVEWAAENDIVNGFTDGTFKPEQAVTREQLAAILSRYASFSGIVIYEPTDALASTDIVSSWAKKDVAWAAAEGILTPAQTADATKNANRAEVAMAIYTYLTKTAK